MKTELLLQFIPGPQGMPSHIAVCATINGIEAHLIIDSGASNCVLDAERAPHFLMETDLFSLNEPAVGLGSDNISTSLSRASVFVLGDFTLDSFPFVLLDLGIINKTFRQIGNRPIDGIIGNDLLLAGKARIDYRKGTIVFKGNRRDLRKWFKNPFRNPQDR